MSLELIEKLTDEKKKNYISKIEELNPNLYLYNLVIRHKNRDSYSPEFIKLCYLTLIAWGMNQRKASLVSFKEFTSQIQKNQKEITKYKSYSITDLHNNKTLQERISVLFNNISITNTKSKIVSTSKLLHFLLPKLLVPIDRKYTLNFLNLNISSKQELNSYISMQIDFSKFANKTNLKYLINKTTTPNIPKVIDNLIISYTKENLKSRVK